MRLIDADALYETVEDHVTTVSVCPTVDWARGKAAMKEICLEDIQNSPTVDIWISVKNRLPEEDVYVLAHNGVAPFIAAHTTNPSNRWYAISGFTICPTHWMPLPEPPKEDNDAEQ